MSLTVSEMSGWYLHMFGKHFATMYAGSLVGKGPVVFAVMGYVVANQMPDREYGSQVRLNSLLLAAIIGTTREEIEKAIVFLCSPDPESTTPDKEGRRLVKIGQFDYQVVNGAKYRAIKNEEDRRAQNRDAQERFRKKWPKKGKPLEGEEAYEKGIEMGILDGNGEVVPPGDR